MTGEVTFIVEMTVNVDECAVAEDVSRAMLAGLQRSIHRRLRFKLLECNEWNRLVTSTPSVRFQPVDYPETRQ